MENASSSHEVMVSGATVSIVQPSLDVLHVASVQIQVSGKNFLTRGVATAALPALESLGKSASESLFPLRSPPLGDLPGAAAIIIGISSKNMVGKHAEPQGGQFFVLDEATTKPAAPAAAPPAVLSRSRPGTSSTGAGRKFCKRCETPEAVTPVSLSERSFILASTERRYTWDPPS